MAKLESRTAIDDIWGGLAAMLVALPSSVAFGILVYSALGAEYSGQGAMFGLVGAAVLGLVTPFLGKTPGLISAPCAPSAAVLSALVGTLVQGSDGERLGSSAILALMGLSAVLSASLQIIYGSIGGGRLIKFIPYPVVSGYLSGVGVLIFLSQLPKLLGLAKGVSLFQGLQNPNLWQWQGAVVGLITIVLMVIAPRLTKRVPGAIFGLFGGISSYFLLAHFWPALYELKGNSLVIGSLHTETSFVSGLLDHLEALWQVDYSLFKKALAPALTLSVLLSIDTLKTCVGLDALMRTRHKSDRELIGQGIGNLISGAMGGMPGAGTMGPTLVNVTSGGHTPRAGVMEGVFVLLALLFLEPYIAWVPIGALAGILLVVASRMIDRNVFRLLKYPSGRLDFLVILGVVIVALSVDLIAASGAGIALAILLFIRDQIKVTVLWQKSSLDQMSSKTQRQVAEKEIIKAHGQLAVICRLQGNLFFGTTDQLFSQLELDLRTRKYVLFDMRRITSLDYTAVHMFEQMHSQLKERGGQLLFSSMPSGMYERQDFESYLKQMGLVKHENGVLIFSTFDSAVEWLEQRILETMGYQSIPEEKILDLTDFQLFRDFGEAELEKIRFCMEELTFKSGEKLVKFGDSGDEIFLIRRGAVQVLLPLSGNRHHHIATVEQGGFTGEVAFLDHKIRSADVVAKSDTHVFLFSRARFNAKSRLDPAIGAQVFARIALEIAHRLRSADAELRALEDR